MKRILPFAQSFEQLPETLGVFPLENAVVLPGGRLPLNIFETRYLNMIRDAMKSHQLIGMIQPKDDSSSPRLYSVGCAGRIVRYYETNDGRIEILLAGLCRFRVGEELATTRGYRMIKPMWSEFSIDFRSLEEPRGHEIERFESLLQRYLKAEGLDADWILLSKLSKEELVNNLVSMLPLSTEDRQILIEAVEFSNRLAAFSAIIEGSHQSRIFRH